MRPKIICITPIIIENFIFIVFVNVILLVASAHTFNLKSDYNELNKIKCLLKIVFLLPGPSQRHMACQNTFLADDLTKVGPDSNIKMKFGQR
jgi:hypothetical protein